MTTLITIINIQVCCNNTELFSQKDLDDFDNGNGKIGDGPFVHAKIDNENSDFEKDFFLEILSTINVMLVESP